METVPNGPSVTETYSPRDEGEVGVETNNSHPAPHSHFQTLYSTSPEFKTPIEGELIGEFPGFLSGGTLITNGPGVFDPRPQGSPYNHILDPLSLIQRFHFDEDKVFFTSEYLMTEALKDVRGGLKFPEEYGTKAYSAKSRTWGWKPSDNAPNNLTRLGNSLFCVSSLGLQAHRVSWDTRSIGSAREIRNWKLHDMSPPDGKRPPKRNGNVRPKAKSPLKLKYMSPNPHRDPSKEFVTNLALTKDSYCILRINAGGDLTVIARIPFIRSPCLIQSFGVSKRFYVFFETPDRLNMTKYAMRRQFGYTLRDCIEWRKNLQTKVYVVDKKGKTCVQFESESLFVSRHVNCYEEGGSLVVDVVAHPDNSRFNGLLIENLRQGAQPSSETELLRFVLPLELQITAEVGENLVNHTGIQSEATCVLGPDRFLRLTPHHLIEQEIEFPVINYSGFNGRKYRYTYALDVPHDGSALWGTKIFKIDVEEGTRWEWRREAGHFFLNPPVFVNDPTRDGEDDGALLVPVTSTNEEADSFLLILDARGLEEVGRVLFPSRIPLSLTGTFIHQIPLEMEEPPVRDKLI